MNLKIMERALVAAASANLDKSLSKGAMHRKRSCAWVERLADELRSQFASAEGDVRVFSKECRHNRGEFGINEMLFDICVCRTELCRSYTARKTLRLITRAIWLIESEFARDSAAALKDFNKLVLGAADNKLFIGPCLGDPDSNKRFRDTLLCVAGRCVNAASGDIYLAQVPHPDGWDGPIRSGITLWRLSGERWGAIV